MRAAASDSGFGSSCAARTGAYFSIAPFAGIALAIAALGEMPGAAFWAALPLVIAGVWLHISERHAHQHHHEPMQHAHGHRHERLLHSHPHYPDIHHRHGH